MRVEGPLWWALLRGAKGEAGGKDWVEVETEAASGWPRPNHLSRMLPCLRRGGGARGAPGFHCRLAFCLVLQFI